MTLTGTAIAGIKVARKDAEEQKHDDHDEHKCDQQA